MPVIPLPVEETHHRAPSRMASAVKKKEGERKNSSSSGGTIS